MQPAKKPIPGLTERNKLNFWRRVNKEGALPDRVIYPLLKTRCWEWTGGKWRAGYGQLRIKRRQFMAHRISWFLQHGSLSVDSCCLHKCDNPPCVNPDHLFLGTNHDNVADRVSKNRTVANGGDLHWSRFKPERIPRGETHRNAKISTADVLDIRKRWTSGESQASIATSFDMTKENINSICLRKTWRHVSADADSAKSKILQWVERYLAETNKITHPPSPALPPT